MDEQGRIRYRISNEAREQIKTLPEFSCEKCNWVRVNDQSDEAVNDLLDHLMLCFDHITKEFFEDVFGDG